MLSVKLTAGIFLAITVAALVPVAHGQEDIRTNVDEVTDRRSTGPMSGLDVKLKTVGALPQGIKAIRFLPDTAKDDLGTDLIKEEENSPMPMGNNSDFNPMGRFGLSEDNIVVSLKLKNPPRRAKYIEQLSGKLELLVPDRDEDAVVVVKNMSKRTEPEVESEKLERQNVELAVMTKEQYEKLQEEEKQTEPENPEEALAEGFRQAFGAMFGGFAASGEETVVIKSSDPDTKIAAIEIVDASGEKIDTSGYSSWGGNAQFSFDEKLPDDAQLRVYLVTDEAIVSYPFELSDIALP